MLLLDEHSRTWNESYLPALERGIRFSWLVRFVESIYDSKNMPLRKEYWDRVRDYERAVAQQRAALHGPWDNAPWVEVNNK